MKVVELYIMRRTFQAFAATLVWVLAIVWTTQVLNRINLVTDSGQSAVTFFTAATLVLPSVIPVVMPFAIGIAVAQTLTTMNTDSELVVMSASGAPRSAIVRPILIIAAGASLFSLFVNNALEPHARQEFRELLSNARADLITSIVQEGTFQEVEEGLFVQIGERLADGQLGGIFVADSREQEVDLVYYARRGATIARSSGSILIMQDGEVHRKTPDGDVSVIQFDSYAFDLSEFSSAEDEPKLFAKDRTLDFLLDPDPDDSYVQQWPQKIRAELHRRLSEWLYPLVFALIGIAVAGDARSFREARLHPMITTMAIALVVRWAGFYAANEAETLPMFSSLLYGIPIATAALAAGFIATGTVMELPTSWTERLLATYDRTGDALTRLRLRLAGFRRAEDRGRT